ncbi:type III polyketide synthase [Nonomuraea sp. 3N208]|uniref:type III polyketide synthase n=1 Tax=Nonomuraea sp. 3N208 TaxID=3457421 RepID=UPI003FD5845C
MTRIAAVRCAFPPHRYPQAELTDMAARVCLPHNADRRLLDRLHRNAKVDYRNLALPIEQYDKLNGFGAANDAFVSVAVDLGLESVKAALDAAELKPTDVDMIMFTSVTGIAAPSVDARLAAALGLRPDVKRVPIFGLGCVAGAAGIARIHDYLRGWPDHVAVLLSVELCSLTVQRGDSSPANLVASALFGDGAAAVVACGGERRAAGPTVVATRSHLYPGSEHVMGWQVGDTGFRVMLDASVPALVRRYLADDVHGLLAEHGVTAGEVTAWVCHPGGPKVLEAVSDVLGLPADALDVTWRSLAANGNLSSSSVLHVLGDTLATRPPEPGTWGLIIAMGPGFCSELVLIRW